MNGGAVCKGVRAAAGAHALIPLWAFLPPEDALQLPGTRFAQ